MRRPGDFIRLVFRARKIQRFLSQPITVAQVFTGREGKQVPVAETVRAFKEILEGKHDDVAEGNFYMKGTIEEIQEAAEGGKKTEEGKKPDSGNKVEESKKPQEAKKA